MDIWKCPEEVTNERCKVKCPVKSSGDLKQAAFTASGRLPQTIISGTPSPQPPRDYRSPSQVRSHTDVAGKLELGMTEPSPWVTAKTRARQLGVPPRSGVSGCSLLAGAQLQWLNVGRQSAGSPSKPLWIKLMQPGVPLQLGLR